MRHTVCLCVDAPDEAVVFTRWLEENREHVTRIGANTGCGCCVLIYDLEVDERATPCPEELCTASAWSEGGEIEGGVSTVEAVVAELGAEPSGVGHEG